jgi:alkaline phosphatase
MTMNTKKILSTAVTFTFLTTALFTSTFTNANAFVKSNSNKKTTVSISAANAKAAAAAKTKAAALAKAKTAAAAVAAAKTKAEGKAKLALIEKTKSETMAQMEAKLAEQEKAKATADFDAKHAKNVIFLIGDGMNSSATTLARWIKGSNLAMDEIVTGSVTNYNSNSVITDSAPAATALATGYKSDSGYVSVYPSVITVPVEKAVDPKDAYKPLATLLEGAKLNGKSTGIIATSQVQHATPAGFTSHNYNRNDYYDIAEQQVYQNLDVVLGGGKEYLVPFDEFNKTDAKGNQIGRKDGVNLIDEIKNLGYTYVEDTASMKSASGNKLWGMFGNEGMSYDYDRDPTKEPSLQEMTSKALEVLSANKDGFFLMVEGSQIDWSAHANDPIGVISDTLAYDKAVQTALEFAKKDGDTLVISLTDHGCGGLTIGGKRTDSGYDTLQLATLVDPLKKAVLTGAGLENKLFMEINTDMSNVQAIVTKYYGISDLTQSEISQVQAYLKANKPGSFNYLIGPMITTRAAIGWTTTGHTGEDVTLYSYGPGNPIGHVDNTDIAKIVAESMELSLDDTNKELYASISENVGYVEGATAEVDLTDPQNPVLVIEKGTLKAELPLSTNKVIINGKTNYAEGLNLMTKSGEVFVSWDALDMIKDAK